MKSHVKLSTGGSLNFSKQVTKKGYAKHLSEDQRLDLLEAMNKTYDQKHTWPEKPK